MKSQFYTYICELQDRITNAMEKVDVVEACFQEDLWDRPEGGGGRTRIIENDPFSKKVG